mgnify:CR=1 FL=1
MPLLPQLVSEYREIVAKEQALARRKLELRAAILNELAALKAQFHVTPYGVAIQVKRFKLHPKAELILEVLTPQDILPFAIFTPKRVRENLVPKYGRERLLPLFEVETIPCLIVKPPPGAEAPL